MSGVDSTCCSCRETIILWCRVRLNFEVVLPAVLKCFRNSASRSSSLVAPLLQHVQSILRDLSVTADHQEVMQSIVTEAIQISAIAGSDLTIDRSVETASLTLLEESLKKLPVQGFLDTAIEAMRSDLLTVSIASKVFGYSTFAKIHHIDHGSRSSTGHREVALGTAGNQNCRVTFHRDFD